MSVYQQRGGSLVLAQEGNLMDSLQSDYSNAGRRVDHRCLCFVTPQHWIANNLFGLAFALNGVELLHLNNVSTGCILLGGLFVYDVFWVRRS